MLSRMLCMFCGVGMVCMRQVRVMGSFDMVAALVMPGGLIVMTRRVLVMFRCLFMMMRCFL
ncbi:MAG: hypothetical protein WBQ95_19475 [Terracidiphilus sp.]